MTNATSLPYIVYPETDGLPMSESDATRDYLLYCVAVLENYFQSRRGVYVSGNLFIYYEEGDPKKVVSPDVFVVFGVNQRKRKSYKTWQEDHRVPQFILEVTSYSTRKQDEVAKPELYARLGVQEYFQYDPTGDYLTPQLKGQRLVNGVYEPMEMTPNWLGLTSIHSSILGLDLCLEPPNLLASLAPASLNLRFYDPLTCEKLLSYIELSHARQEAQQEVLLERQKTEVERQKTEVERQKTEVERQKVDRLAQKLRSLGIDPDTGDLL